MTQTHSRRSLMLLFALLTAYGCSGGAGGCAGMTPLPAPYTGPKTDNALNLQLSPEGINYINNNWQQLVELIAPGGTIQVPVGCLLTNVAVIGDLTIADQGNATAQGRLDGNCDARDLPAQVGVTITRLNLAVARPDVINGTVDLRIDTGKIYARTKSGNSIVCLGLGAASCSLRFNTASQSPTSNSITAQVKFEIDQKWDKLLSFNVVTPIKGTQVCGSSGASALPFCLDPGDVNIDGENTCGNIWCGLADWDPVKNLVLSLVSPTLQTQIASLVAAQSCQSCGAGLPACPRVGTATSSCVDGICMDTAANPDKCVPRFLGVEGQIALSSVLGTFGVPDSAKLNLSVAAGSSFSIDSNNAINIGTRAGMEAPVVAPCVPPAVAPPMVAVNAPDFRADAPPVSAGNPAYHAAVGISQPFLDLAFHQAQQSGAICISLTSATVGLVNTGLFKTFLPSLGKLATRDGQDAPMMVVLKPAKPPTVKIGEGTFDPVTKKPIKPLLAVTMQDVSVDIYAMIDERYARLFTITIDIALPVSLIFHGCSSVEPALGDLKMLISNVRTANSEMLAEDPKVLADLIPAVIGLAEPALASALKPFALPALGAFQLKVNAAKGVGKIAGTENYNHLGLYATMLPAGAVCAVTAPRTVASLKRSVIPPEAQMKLTGSPLPIPEAVLQVQSTGMEGTPEYQYRVDQGFWSTFVPATKDGELSVQSPVFLMQGTHIIEVRSRMSEEPAGLADGVQVRFTVDWAAPELKLSLDRLNDRMLLTAHDTVSPDDALQYSYKLGSEDGFSEFGPKRELVWSVIEQQGGVTIRVRDQAGNVGEKVWRVPTVDLSSGTTPDAPLPGQGPQSAGCSAAGSVLLYSGFALLVLALRTLRGSRRFGQR